MKQYDTSSGRAMRLLALVRASTENSNEPVFVEGLAEASQLSIPQVHAAWAYLRDHGLIQTFSIPHTARINAMGIDALDTANSPAMGTTGDVGILSSAVEGATMSGYGRTDSQEALDRAREVSNELRRLHELLPKLTNAELSAYSTKSLPIGTFLNAKGHAFSVVTEDMLANAFKEEVDQRKSNTTADRWLRKIKDNPVIATLVILGIVVAGIAAFVENVGKLELFVHPNLSMDAQIASDLTIQVDLCTFDRGNEQTVECVTHGACRGPGAQGLPFPIDKSSKESAVYTCKQSCVSEAKKQGVRCATPPAF